MKTRSLFIIAFSTTLFFLSVSCKDAVRLQNTDEAMYDEYSLLAKTSMPLSLDYSIDQLSSGQLISATSLRTIVYSSANKNYTYQSKKDTVYSAGFKKMIEIFVLRLKTRHYFTKNDDFRIFFLDYVNLIQNKPEKEKAAEVISMACEFNTYFKKRENSLRMTQLLINGSFSKYKSGNLMKIYKAVTVVDFIIAEVVTFILGYLASPYIFSPCDPNDTWCNIGWGILWGVAYSFGAFLGICEYDLLPWQVDTNQHLGCWGQSI